MIVPGKGNAVMIGAVVIDNISGDPKATEEQKVCNLLLGVTKKPQKMPLCILKHSDVKAA